MLDTTSRPGPGEAPRPLDGLLAGFVAGALEPHLHALVAAHLMLSDENRAFVRALEEAAGDELESQSSAPPLRAARDHVLAAIYSGGWYGRPKPVPLDPDVPTPLSRLLGHKLSETPWRVRAPGVRQHTVHRDDKVSATLYRIRSGRGVLLHTHRGTEVTLVLKGVFSDHTGSYGRGDITIADRTVSHRPVSSGDEDCISFAVVDGPMEPVGVTGWLLSKVFRE